MRTPRLLAAGFTVLGLASAAFGQGARGPTPPTTTPDWNHGSTLSLFGGGTTADGRTSGLAGGAIGWEVTPRWTVEGSGEWQVGSRSHDAFGAALTTSYGLWRTRYVMPLVLGGVGLYRISFDDTDGMPAFYRNRLAAQSRLGPEVSFTDPMFVAGIGAGVFVSRHWSIQPDVRTAFVTRHDHAYTRTTATVRVAYHFEDHPVTPSVR
jgi:hypothetical protein